MIRIRMAAWCGVISGFLCGTILAYVTGLIDLNILVYELTTIPVFSFILYFASEKED